MSWDRDLPRRSRIRRGLPPERKSKPRARNEKRARVAAGEDIYIAFPTYTFPHTLSLRPEWAGPMP